MEEKGVRGPELNRYQKSIKRGGKYREKTREGNTLCMSTNYRCAGQEKSEIASSLTHVGAEGEKRETLQEKNRKGGSITLANNRRSYKKVTNGGRRWNHL